MSKTLSALCFCLVACCLLAAKSRADETKTPVDDALTQVLTTAVNRLDQQDSYRWTTEIEVPEESRFRPGPTHGTTVKGGATHVTLSFGPRSTHVVIDGKKAAVTNRDGRWETVSLSDQGYGSEGFAASIAKGIQTPVVEAKELVSALQSLEEEGDVLIGTLAVDASNARLARRRGVESVRDAKGIVRFSIKDGVLTKYVLRVEGTLVDDDQPHGTWRQTTVEVKDAGTAKLDLPRGATEALKRPVPKAQSRLPDAEAAALLKLRGKRDVGVHDPSSIVKCDGEYWFFSTGTGVSSWRSKDLQTWQRGPRVFPKIPDWVTDVVPGQRGHFWAPDVIQLKDRYLLYYSVSSFGKNTSAIALASTPTLDPDDPAFGWTDEGIVIQSSSKDDFNAIDPAVIRTESGELWMSFGSFWSGLKLIRLDPKSGKRMADDGPLHSIASYRQIEAPHIYQHDEWYYLFINWGKCCSGVDSTYNIRVGRSRNITGPYLDKDGVDLAKGGGTLLLGSEGPFIGPGHANVFRDGDRYLLSCHYYDGTERGRSKLSIQELTWSKEGWPAVAKTPSFEQTSNRSDQVPSDQVPREWFDPKTGHRVVRLSKQAGSASLYFHQNAYTPEGDKLLISTPRGLETVDLRTRELNVVVSRQSYRMSGSSGVEMGRKSRYVYYSTRSREGTVVRATHVDTGKTHDIVSLPRGASFNGVNADETLLFGSMQEFRPRQASQGDDRNRDRRRRFERSMKLFTAEIATGKVTTFHPSSDWLNHLQCSPTDPNLGLFCHEGSWHELDRVWTIRFGSDDAKLMHKRQQEYEIAGHEFFSTDGQWVWYDLQTPRADQFWLAGVHFENGQRIGYRLPRDQWSVHYNISRDGKLFAGDGGGPESVANQTPLPEKRRLKPPRNGQWIYLFRPNSEFTDATLSGQPAKLGTMTAQKLVDLSTHDYNLEPNVTFTPDGKWIVFRSNMHGERHVYMVSVEREANPRDVVPTESATKSETTFQRRRLVLIGDSTVKNGRGKGDGGLFGWGQVLDQHFDTERIEIENRALGGRSSRTYLTEGLWKKSLDRVRKGDFVMMQFGHNDGGKMFEGDRPRASIKGNSDERIDGVVESTGKAETVRSFGWYLRKYVADAKAKGAIPIVLSQVPRDRWEDGRVIRADKDYGLWARQAAEQSGALFMDLNEIVSQRYEESGAEKVDREFFTPNDWTHTTRSGAEGNAACVVAGIRALEDCSLKDYLRQRQGDAAKKQSTWHFDFTDEREVERRFPALLFDRDGRATFALKLDEGNYSVKLRFGDREHATSTTVKAESRRLMIENVETAPGEFVEKSVVVNVRRPEIGSGDSVRLNHRELGPPLHPSWDDLLTFEFVGSRPRVASMTIRQAPEVTTIFIAGDSTVTDQKKEPYAGWGQMLPRFFGPNVAVSNHAESGLALRSFEYQMRLKKVLSQMKPGDYMLIQFGHNDQKDTREEAGPFTTYQAKLAQFVDSIREKRGIPVLITSMERLRMDESGKQTPTLADYAEAVRQVGSEKEVPVIDLNAMSLEFYAALGPKRATKAFAFYPAGTFPGQEEALKDRTHHNSYGAYELARCVIEGIRSQVPELATHLTLDMKAFDPSAPEDPDRFDLSTRPIIQTPR